MKTFAVYEKRDQEKLKLVKIENNVKAMTHESARRKAIIGTTKQYDNTRAYPYQDRNATSKENQNGKLEEDTQVD